MAMTTRRAGLLPPERFLKLRLRHPRPATDLPATGLAIQVGTGWLAAPAPAARGWPAIHRTPPFLLLLRRLATPLL